MSTQSLVAELRDWAAAQAYAPQVHNYGRDADQVADLAVPKGHDRYPVVVLIHGGFWRSGYDRTLMDALAAGFLQRGYVTWNVEYRRGPGAGASGASVQDVTAAIAMLRLIPEPLDLKRVTVIGHSAGGHLALLAAPSSRARLVVSLAGICDLAATAGAHLDSDAAAEWMGTTLAADPGGYALADPIARLPTGARTLLVHGDRDDRVPIGQSRAYRAAATQAADDCTLLELPGEGHFNLIDPRSAAFAAYADRLMD